MARSYGFSADALHCALSVAARPTILGTLRSIMLYIDARGCTAHGMTLCPKIAFPADARDCTAQGVCGDAAVRGGAAHRNVM